MPFVKRTRAILRNAEFGFLGVMVRTTVQTPRFCGQASSAGTDANFVMTGKGHIVEVQGTAEGEPFTEETFTQLMSLARNGILQLVDLQRKAIAK